MDHPLISDNQNALRRRVIQLLKSGYSLRDKGNIIFVCGGNNANHMRIRFREFCAAERPDFQLFFPEYAIKNYFEEGGGVQFDLSDFEALIGKLSHAIVLFPEAAGSYAEAGYFSAIEEIAEKTILSLDSQYQSEDSFISFGPAVKFNSSSQFRPSIQVNYADPIFTDIVSRIERLPFSKKKRNLKLDKFGDLGEYDLFCLVHKIFELLGIATYSDLKFIFRGIFKTHFKEMKLKQVTSILIGSKYLKNVGSFGHYAISRNLGSLMEAMLGRNDEENSIQLEITDLALVAEPAFKEIWEASRNDL